MSAEKLEIADEAPYYLALGDEVEIFLSAYKKRLPVLLKGPTGCGKTRFVEHVGHKIYGGRKTPQAPTNHFLP